MVDAIFIGLNLYIFVAFIRTCLFYYATPG